MHPPFSNFCLPESFTRLRPYKLAMMSIRTYPKLIILATVVLLSGCGQASFVTQRTSIQDDVISRSASTASIQKLDKIPDSKSIQFRLFRQLNRGGLFFFSQKFDSSLIAFDMAEDIIEDQYTRRVSQEVSSVLTNQYSVNYTGYPVEHLFVHFFKSLIFLQQDNIQGAAIEVRKLQLKLDYLESHQDPYKITRADFKLFNEYSAWIAWLNGDENDARVNFRLTGVDFDSLKYTLPTKDNAHLKISLNGLISELNEAYYRLIVTTDEDVHTLKVAYPVNFNPFLSTPSNVGPLTGTTRSSGMDVNAEFEKQFEISEKALLPKTFTRVATKFILAEAATQISDKMLEEREEERQKKKEKGEKVEESDGVDAVLIGINIFGNIMKVTNDVTEKADLRQWFTLPSSVTISLLSQKPEKTDNPAFPLISTNLITVEFNAPQRLNKFNPNEFERTDYLDFSGKNRPDYEEENRHFKRNSTDHSASESRLKMLNQTIFKPN